MIIEQHDLIILPAFVGYIVGESLQCCNLVKGTERCCPVDGIHIGYIVVRMSL